MFNFVSDNQNFNITVHQRIETIPGGGIGADMHEANTTYLDLTSPLLTRQKGPALWGAAP